MALRVLFSKFPNISIVVPPKQRHSNDWQFYQLFQLDSKNTLKLVFFSLSIIVFLILQADIKK